MSTVTLKNVVAIETPMGLVRLMSIEEYNQSVIDKVKSLLLEYTHYDSRDNVTFMDNVNFEVILEELDNLFDE